MSNVKIVECSGDMINKLITAAKKENRIFMSCDDKAIMCVVFGFDYILEYGCDRTGYLRTNLINWDHIVFVVPKGSNNERIKVKLIKFVDDPNSINFNESKEKKES